MNNYSIFAYIKFKFLTLFFVENDNTIKHLNNKQKIF